ncbi:hypothetical protein NQ317_007585 [Molorchus minor]|uniref:C2H2-type domain-containing protein n=1 Tax=Molorchus minor TaxID=1323400 RepID=A0ABQ9IVI0_9CUCU|nr:hypothetical protein NQ317_007585 [Molorchus minor]
MDETWVIAGHTCSNVLKNQTILTARQAFNNSLSTGGLFLFKFKKTNDYHKKMNEYVFQQWIQNILKLLECNAVNVMDNSPYHSVEPEKTLTSSWRKGLIVNWIPEKGVHFDEPILNVWLLALVKITSEVIRCCTSSTAWLRQPFLLLIMYNFWFVGNKKIDTIDVGTSTESSKNEFIKVTEDVLRTFISPVIDVEKLENTDISYVKVGEITYKEAGSNLDLDPNLTKHEIKKQKFMDYYYSTPTTALQELIKGSDTVSNSKVKKAPLITEQPDTNESLIEIHDVFHVEVCSYCSKSFKTKQQLRMHCAQQHKGIRSLGNIKKCRKSAKNRKFKCIKSYPDNPDLGSDKKANAKSDINHLLNMNKKHAIFTSDYSNFPNLKFLKEHTENTLTSDKLKNLRKQKINTNKLNLENKNHQQTENSDINTAPVVDSHLQSEIVPEPRIHTTKNKTTPQKASKFICKP